jgi:integrase
MLQALQRGYIAKYGVESLLAKRKEPLDYGMLRTLLAIPCGTYIGPRRLDWDDPLFFNLRAAFTLAGSTGLRKDEISRLRRGNLLWEIDGVFVADATKSQLESLVLGRDRAIIRMGTSKADQYGLNFGPLPVYQP